MLKGILFIIAIIVTFDIGKALIDSYREEQAQESTQEKNENGAASTSTSELTNTESEKSDENANTPSVNLNLPEDIQIEEQEETSSASQSSFPTSGENEKSFNLKAKPIMTFDVETRTPDVTGVTVEVKKTY